MLILQVPSLCSSLTKEVYNPRAFLPHAVLLRQAFAHCGKFPTAASRRSLGRVSVPVWLIKSAVKDRGLTLERPWKLIKLE